MGRSKTRKVKSKVLTIPMLRKAFEQINMETRKILAKHPINSESVKEFQKLWKHTFGKSIDYATAESYLVLQSKQKKSNKKTKKMKSGGNHYHGGSNHYHGGGNHYHGGAAPVDFMLRPGVDSTYGSYLPYLNKGLDFYGDINNIAMDADCGKVNFTPQIASSMGSNQVGAGLSELVYGLSTRPIGPSTPPSLLQDVQDYSLGKQLGASPKPIETHYSKV